MPKETDILALICITPQGGVDPIEAVAAVAGELSLFEDGSITNMADSVNGNAISFKPLKAAHLEAMKLPVADDKTFAGPPTGIGVEPDLLDAFGRPLRGATTKPKLGLSGRNDGTADFLKPGSPQVCAGCAIYSPSTMHVLTLGKGAHAFTLGPMQVEWVLRHPNLRGPETPQHRMALCGAPRRSR